ncbi:MAG: SPASM domain-containing protein, partial [Candidatus Riflebacteria bacterium]|nr:SPASM domain-containing protein [Candidatus Riflebacteria bacterium]
MKYYQDTAFNQLHATINGNSSVNCPEKLYINTVRRKLCDPISVNIPENHMPFAVFKKLIDETAQYVKSYALVNGGEVLFLNDFEKRLLYIKHNQLSNATIEIHSYGDALTTENIKFLHDNLVKVNVSFCAPTNNLHTKITGRSNFNKVCENLQELVSVYNDVDPSYSPALYIRIQKLNQNKIFAITRLAKELGIRKLAFWILNDPTYKAALPSKELRRELEEVYKFIDKSQMLLWLYPLRVGNYIFSGTQYRPVANYILNTSCCAPVISSMIDFDGAVYSCLERSIYIDNINNNPFIDIWRGQRYEYMRNIVNSPGQMPEQCKKCQWANR